MSVGILTAVSRPVVGTEIQTSCNFKANLPDRYYPMVFPAVFSVMYLWNPLTTCLMISIVSCKKIFLAFRHQNQAQDHVQQPNQTNQLNIARYENALSTAICLQLRLVACYLPYGVAFTFITNGEKSLSVSHTWIYTSPLGLSNSSINPFLYCWKLEEVRQAVKDTIRQVLCRCFST